MNALFYLITPSKLILAICLLSLFAVQSIIHGQSMSQEFPTAITTNEISGVISARDIGDSRLTTYYYSFEGSTGDVFVNVVTKNFTGDVDVFAVNGLRPLTKIVIYADLAETETGRVIYFRKPEKILLRVQGRTPGDDAAMFRIKFAGSFVAAKETEAAPEPPKVTASNETGIRLNSIGTIVPGEPKPSPRAVVETAENPVSPDTTADDAPIPEKTASVISEPDTNSDDVIPVAESEIVIKKTTEAEIEKSARETPPTASRSRTRRGRRAAVAKRPVKTAKAVKAPETVEDPPVDPLANIRLVIQFKDGKLIERPMNEVFKFSVDKGVLTVISKDGSIGRFSILDVDKVTIQ